MKGLFEKNACKKLTSMVLVAVIIFSPFASNFTVATAKNDLASTYTDSFHQKTWRWGLEAIHAEGLKSSPAVIRNISDITVAVIDTGLDITHPAFEGKIVKPQNFTGDGSETDVTDYIGHGTHVAGIIAADASDIDIIGVACGVKIMPLKVVSPHGKSGASNLIKAIEYAADNGADVINISLAIKGNVTTKALTDAISYARSKGCVLVAGAGNDGGEICAPARLDGVIAVGAAGYDVGDDGNKVFYKTNFSNYDVAANSKFLYAPGVDILSAYPGNLTDRDSSYSTVFGTNGEKYTYLSGTSMATAFVSGAACLLKANGSAGVYDDLFSMAYPQTLYLQAAGGIVREERDNMSIMNILNCFAKPDESEIPIEDDEEKAENSNESAESASNAEEPDSEEAA